MLELTQGDMFEVPVDIRVNTVNCVGAMGAGVALAFKRRYPDMFKDYQRDCRKRPGQARADARLGVLVRRLGRELPD